MYVTQDEATFKQIFQLKFSIKQMEKAAKKAESEAEKKKKEMAAYLKKGDTERAKVYGEMVLQKRAESVQHLRMAQKIDIIKGKFEAAKAAGKVSKAVASSVKAMEKINEDMAKGKSMDLVARYEKALEDSEVQAMFMDEALAGASGTTAVASSDVQALIDEMSGVAATKAMDLPAVPATPLSPDAESVESTTTATATPNAG